MKNQRGFTLIEILIAVSLLAIISMLVWQAMGSAVVSKDRFEKRERVYRTATLVIDRAVRELGTAVLFSSVDMLGIASNGEQSIKSVFTGTNNGDQDKLTFETLSHIRYLKDVKESDQAEVTYFLEKSEEDEEVAGPFVLRKREKSPPDSEVEQGGSVTTLLEGVNELNIRYYDLLKNEFIDEWDSTKIDFSNRLPRAVEITLVMQDPLDEELTIRFVTVALLEMAPGPNDF